MAPSKAHFAAIDGLRAVAVLSVIAYHALGRISATHPASAGAIAIGTRGVDLFFVISGFCLAYPVLVAHRAGVGRPLDASAYLHFLGRRFSRIAPPFYAAVALFGVLAFTPFGAPTAAASHPNALAIAGDAFADLTFSPATNPVLDGSFWTLGFEMAWYVVCPFAIALYVRSRLAFLLAGLALYACYFSPFGPAEAGCLPTFMLGIVAADLALRGGRGRGAIARLALPTLAVAIATQVRDPGADHGDPLWALASFTLVVAGTTGIAARAFGWRPFAWIGLVSYAIYLAHQPVLDWLLARGAPWYLAAAAGIGTGVLFWWTVERPLARPERRRALENALGGFARRALRNSSVARRVFRTSSRDAVDAVSAV